MAAINFKYEILKTKLLDYKQQNWNAVQSTTFKRDVVDVSSEIVKIPNGVELGFLSAKDLINQVSYIEWSKNKPEGLFLCLCE